MGRGDGVQVVERDRTFNLQDQADAASRQALFKFKVVNGLGDRNELLFSRSAAKGYRRANNFSQRFARVLRNDIKIVDSKLTFHSFKHTFATAVARAHLPRHVEYDLCRHARSADAHSVYLHGSKMTVLLNALSSVDPLL